MVAFQLIKKVMQCEIYHPNLKVTDVPWKLRVTPKPCWPSRTAPHPQKEASVNRDFLCQQIQRADPWFRNLCVRNPYYPGRMVVMMKPLDPQPKLKWSHVQQTQWDNMAAAAMRPSCLKLKQRSMYSSRAQIPPWSWQLSVEIWKEMGEGSGKVVHYRM